jgi:hypothetical protein
MTEIMDRAVRENRGLTASEMKHYELLRGLLEATDEGFRSSMGLSKSRVGDAQRTRYLAHLGEMFAEGYLDQNEYGKRSDAAVAAVYYSDLTPLLNDLPPLPAEAVPVPRKPFMTWELSGKAIFVMISFLALIIGFGSFLFWLASAL